MKASRLIGRGSLTAGVLNCVRLPALAVLLFLTALELLAECGELGLGELKIDLKELHSPNNSGHWVCYITSPLQQAIHLMVKIEDEVIRRKVSTGLISRL
jgi:hypothetical protein